MYNINFLWIYWNCKKSLFTIPYLNFPVMWYSVFFACGFIGGFFIFKNIFYFYLKCASSKESDIEIKKNVNLIADKLLTYMFVSTVIGARLGHFFFYESPSFYLVKDPFVIFRIWEGGLSSHGAGIAIIISIIYFSYNYKNKYNLSFLRTFDFVAISTSFAAVFIRLGNFFNQEIIGRPTNMPWGIIFLNPLDNLSIVPRHPAQLYEAIFYLVVFLFLWTFFRNKVFFTKQGFIFSIFLICIFSFRFFIEFFKIEYSLILNKQILLMAQFLSLPFIFFGIFLFFYCRKYIER